MESSPTLGELTKALVKVQSELKSVKKEAENPFFHSKYAELSSVLDVVRKPLADNGLAIVQVTSATEGGDTLDTILLHTSGEWISGKLSLNPVKNDPQGIGSAITYARRYTLMAMLGVAAEDDDGEAASDNTPKSQQAKSQPPKEQKEFNPQTISQAQITKIFAAAKEKHLSDTKIHDYLMRKYGVESTKDLTKSQASELIEKIEGIKSGDKP